MARFLSPRCCARDADPGRIGSYARTLSAGRLGTCPGWRVPVAVWASHKGRLTIAQGSTFVQYQLSNGTTSTRSQIDGHNCGVRSCAPNRENSRNGKREGEVRSCLTCNRLRARLAAARPSGTANQPRAGRGQVSHQRLSPAPWGCSIRLLLTFDTNKA